MRTRILRALLAFDRDRADYAIETALALRSVEDTVEAFLLTSLEQIVARNGPNSAAWAFAGWWAAEWLARARRRRHRPPGRLSILLGYASKDELDLDAHYIRALQLFCERAGVKVLSLPARALNGLGGAAMVHCPDVVVLAGRQLDDDTIARWASLIGRSLGPLPLAIYRSPLDPVRGTVLPPAPSEAQLRLLDVADGAIPASLWQLARGG